MSDQPSMALLKEFLRGVSAHVAHIDRDRCIAWGGFVTPEVQQQLVGRRAADFVAPDDRDALEQLHAGAFEGRLTRAEVRATGLDGREAHFECYAGPIEDDPERICVIAVDITARVEREAALARSEARLRVALSATGIGLWSWDMETDRIEMDARMRTICGAPPEGELTGAFLHERCPDDDRARVDAALQVAEETGHFEPLSHRYILPDGSVRWVLCSGQLRDGGPLLLGGTLDITEHRLLEEGMRRRQRMATLGSLAAGLAHNFNNLLMAILPATDFLLDHVQDGHRPILHSARQAAERGVELVDELAAFAGARPRSSREPAPVAQLVMRAVAICGSTFPPSVTITTDVQSALPPVVCDAGAIEHALINLLLNARDAVLDGPRDRQRVAVTVALVEAEERAGGLARPEVQITVRDQGVGMAPEVARRVFEPFFTTKGAAGTGLGLATVQATVEDHGGRISCESTPGVGTTFTFGLPVAQPIGALEGPPRG